MHSYDKKVKEEDQENLICLDQKINIEIKEIDKENNKIERLNGSSYRLNSVFDK